ncbi:MAG: hypothetical protein ACJAUH_003315, partial [Saprospiraceae bacterium]
NEAKFLCMAIVMKINFNEVIGNILSKNTDMINLTYYLGHSDFTGHYKAYFYRSGVVEKIFFISF